MLIYESLNVTLISKEEQQTPKWQVLFGDAIFYGRQHFNLLECLFAFSAYHEKISFYHLYPNCVFCYRDGKIWVTSFCSIAPRHEYIVIKSKSISYWAWFMKETKSFNQKVRIQNVLWYLRRSISLIFY